MLVEHRVHHFGNAMAFGFRCEPLHQKDNDQTADNGRKQDPVAEPARPLADIGVIPDAERAVVKRVVKKSDQRAQGDGAAARHDAYDQRKAAQNQEIDPPVVVTGCRVVVGEGG
jgi:hypothetical protein